MQTGLITSDFFNILSNEKDKKKTFFKDIWEDKYRNIFDYKQIKLTFISVIDKILYELRSRFEASQKLSRIFGFLQASYFPKFVKTRVKCTVVHLGYIYKKNIAKAGLLV